jgi:hypothetical protein
MKLNINDKYSIFCSVIFHSNMTCSLGTIMDLFRNAYSHYFVVSNVVLMSSEEVHLYISLS